VISRGGLSEPWHLRWPDASTPVSEGGPINGLLCALAGFAPCLGTRKVLAGKSRRPSCIADEWLARGACAACCNFEAEAYPYLFVDARYEKVRVDGRVVSQGVLVVSGVREDGFR
jgi:Transposase, Mutator family